MEDELVLVDLHDKEIGNMGKSQVHGSGKLHRAFSVFIVHGNKMLIQKRNPAKYHSGGKWANACCSHPRKGEKLSEAVHRRLKEELGIDCPLKEIAAFTYHSKFQDGLFEFEYDHVFIGEYSGEILFDPDEIEEVKWVDLETLEKDVVEEPEKYAVWFLTAITEVLKYLEKGGRRS